MSVASPAATISPGALLSLRTTPFARSDIAVLIAVALAHGGALALLASGDSKATPSATTLTVQVITPAAVAAVAPPVPSPPSRARPLKRQAPPPKAEPVRRPIVAAASAPTATTATAADAPTPLAAPSAPAQASSPPAAAVPAPAPATVAVTPARFNADYLRNPAPPYPAVSRRLGEEGKVVLRVLVTTDGRAGQVELASGSGSARLDQAAQEAVARWKFIAARRGDEAVAAWVLVPIVFSLGA